MAHRPRGIPDDTPDSLVEVWTACVGKCLRQPIIQAAFHIDKGWDARECAELVKADPSQTERIVTEFIAWFNEHIWAPR